MTLTRSRFSLKEIQSTIVLVALALAGCRVQVWAQCASGDILWVSETVNANVGTATGGGGTTTQCAARTVAGAAYNNPAQPFGIQGAFDCACPGAEIRIVAGANNYDSTTASWTNRLAGQEVQMPTASGSLSAVNPLRIVGYSGGQPCYTLQDAGCPVEVDFAGGTGDGFDNAGNNFGMAWIGIHVTNAARVCMNMDGGSQYSAFMSVEVSNCLLGGFTALGITDQSFMYGYAHGNTVKGYSLPTGAGAVFMEAHDNVGSGLELDSWTSAERFLAYDQTGVAGGGFGYSTSGSSQILYGTMARNSLSGWQGGAGIKDNSGGWGLIATGNGDWGMEDFSGSDRSMSLFQCWVAGGNTTGAFTPSSVGGFGIGGNLDDATVPTFASATDFSVSGVAACGYSYPGTTTTSVSCPGASPTCLGGGLFIQPVRIAR